MEGYRVLFVKKSICRSKNSDVINSDTNIACQLENTIPAILQTLIQHRVKKYNSLERGGILKCRKRLCFINDEQIKTRYGGMLIMHKQGSDKILWMQIRPFLKQIVGYCRMGSLE